MESMQHQSIIIGANRRTRPPYEVSVTSRGSWEHVVSPSSSLHPVHICVIGQTTAPETTIPTNLGKINLKYHAKSNTQKYLPFDIRCCLFGERAS